MSKTPELIPNQADMIQLLQTWVYVAENNDQMLRDPQLNTCCHTTRLLLKKWHIEQLKTAVTLEAHHD